MTISNFEYALLANHVYEKNFRVTDEAARQISENGQPVIGQDGLPVDINGEDIAGWKYLDPDSIADTIGEPIPFLSF